MKVRRFSKFKLFVVSVFALVAVHHLFFSAPTEAQMLAKFHQHKAEFEQIRLMLQQDKNVETIGPHWVDAKWNEKGELPLNVSESRIALYRSRLKTLGFSRVDAHDSQVQLEEFGGGFTDTSWGIGYIWSAKPLTPLVKSAYTAKLHRDDRCVSRIEGNWYLYQRR